MNYVGRVSPPILPVPPEGALYWDFVNGNLYGSLPGTGVWGLIGGECYSCGSTESGSARYVVQVFQG